MELRLLRRRLKFNSTAASRVPAEQQSINRQALSLLWNHESCRRVIFVAALPQLQCCLPVCNRSALTYHYRQAAFSAARKRKCCSPAVMDIWPPPDKRQLGVLCHRMYTRVVLCYLCVCVWVYACTCHVSAMSSVCGTTACLQSSSSRHANNKDKHSQTGEPAKLRPSRASNNR
jgi:hypothetical protein